MHLDFTNNEAVKWWNKRLDKVFIDGVYGWKVDQGEAAFGDTVITSIGKIPQKEFRKYYYNSMFDYAVSKNKNEGMIIARPYSHQTNLDGFAASIEKMSVGWCGDFSGDWSGIKMQINDIYKSADAGYGAIACEIGGFQSKHSTKAQLIRYTQLGSMVATMVNGGSNGAFTNHLPWYHDKETSDIYRYYVNLHYELRNYIFSSLVDAHLHGGSLIKDVSFKEESHKLGNSIFFKAITSDTNMVSFTLPKDGEWIDFWTNEKYAGAAKITKEYALDKAPIFIKMGAIIPLEIDNKVTGLGDKSFAGKIVILLYPKGKSTYLYHKPLGDGIEYSDIEIAYEAGKISVKAEEKNSYVFLIKDQNGVETFEKDGKSFDLVLRK
jgi:alpha-glucosidase (family GH31 glycosyl hydrolase)